MASSTSRSKGRGSTPDRMPSASGIVLRVGRMDEQDPEILMRGQPRGGEAIESDADPTPFSMNALRPLRRGYPRGRFALKQAQALMTGRMR